MIKHGKVFDVYSSHRQHLSPIIKYVKKGIADATESVTLQPEASDMRGAKRFDGQRCVIARCLNRKLHPQAVAVGRVLAYAVFDGLAIRFFINNGARKVVEEFDERGRVIIKPIVLSRVPPSQLIHINRTRATSHRGKKKKKRIVKRVDVRAVGGGKVISLQNHA